MGRCKLIASLMGIALSSFAALNGGHDSIVNRPYELYDTSAFCKYRGFHPTNYLTDNNWDILCAFIIPGKAERLDSLGIPYNESQLRLLEVGDLLSSDNGTYLTKMPVFSQEETEIIRSQSKEFVNEIYPHIENEIDQLIGEIDSAGYRRQTYSLIFSYLLDNYIWGDGKLPDYDECDDHGTWTGAFWAMFFPRKHAKIGTNGYGVVKQNWTDDLGYWLRSDKLLSFAKEVKNEEGNFIYNQEVIDAIEGWGLTDKKGRILIPVIRKGNNDNIDILCQDITTKLSDAVKSYCVAWCDEFHIQSDKLAQIIFYHEVMWDMLDMLEEQGKIRMPAILKGEEVGKEHFGDICFIVI